MGLDMYLFATTADAPENANADNTHQIGYWRKHADLHGYVENLYRAANPDFDDSFNCVPVELSEADVRNIIECAKKGRYEGAEGTTGFFFGRTDHEYDDVETVKIMEQALEELAAGNRIIYDSWW